MTGTCTLALMSQTDFQFGAVSPEMIAVTGGTLTIGELESNADECPDVATTASGATLTGFVLPPVRRI